MRSMNTMLALIRAQQMLGISATARYLETDDGLPIYHGNTTSAAVGDEPEPPQETRQQRRQRERLERKGRLAQIPKDGGKP